jgi:glyoxylase-like metal-dependent hydrolase (beta-lactamase superfamily II)
MRGKGGRYTRGLHDLGDGLFAWLQPDGSWGFSNAGLVTDGDASLLVDTLFDLRLTRQMLDAMRAASPAAARIDVLVNTHANGDHCFGNELVEGARILASKACAEEMGLVTPATMHALLENADALGQAGAFFRHAFGAFDFAGIRLTPPTETFTGRTECQVGDRLVRLLEVGPAHTRGDVVVEVPSQRVVFSGDILFIDGHPILWEGPIGNWIGACDAIAAMRPEVVVPGHGPLTDLAGVQRVREYLVYIRDEARKRFDAGLPAREAARDISLADYASWGDAERIAVNVATLYREFGDPGPPPGPLELFGWMAELERDRRASAGAAAGRPARKPSEG